METKEVIQKGKTLGWKITGVILVVLTVVIVGGSLISVVFGEGVKTADYIGVEYTKIQRQRESLDDKETTLCEEAKTALDEKTIVMLQDGEINRDEIIEYNEIIKEGDCTKIFDKLFLLAEK